MDRETRAALAHDLFLTIGAASVPIVVDIRSADDRVAIDRIIPGAISCVPDDVTDWWRSLPSSHPVVVCDMFGGRQSQDLAARLATFGTAASYLVDGFAGWFERGFPTRLIGATNVSRWVTRERPKIDRIACPWLIRRFVHPLAEFIYVPADEVLDVVPADEVLDVAEQMAATPYDIKGVIFTHEGAHCSFDKIIGTFDLRIPALDRLARIVRGADTARPDLAAECAGLLAVSRGLSVNFPDDHMMLEHGMVIYDALFSSCKLDLEAESRLDIGQRGVRGG
jgi:rhodanese-related sulfurtransferase